MSNKNVFLKKLESMKGKTFVYGNTIHCVIDYTIDEQNEKCTIKTNLDTYVRKYESMDKFLQYWNPQANIVVKGAEQPKEREDNPELELAVYAEQGKSLADEMIGILKDNIAKVQQSKEYIPQAQSINNNVNSIINLAKLKFMAQKHAKR